MRALQHAYAIVLDIRDVRYYTVQTQQSIVKVLYTKKHAMACQKKDKTLSSFSLLICQSPPIKGGKGWAGLGWAGGAEGVQLQPAALKG